MTMIRSILCTLLVFAAGCSRSGEAPAPVATPTVAPAAAPKPAPQAAAAAAEEIVLITFIEADEEVGTAPLTVHFSVYDPYQQLQRPKYRWDFGDGSPISEERFPVHVFEKPGDYEVKLVVEEYGVTDEDSIEIQVRAPEAAGE
jgi:hypothetical protein